MCVVIDTNLIPSVFNTYSSRHKEFSPLLGWIMNRKGKFVYGGTKYGRELSNLRRYLRLFEELEKSGRTYHADDRKVDSVEAEIKSKTVGTTFNDQHIVAIVIVSRCILVCSANKAHYAFIKTKSLYPKNCRVPIIYSGLKNAGLLTARHVARNCGPCSRSYVY